MAVIGAWIAGVIGFKLSVGLAAFLAASILVLMAVADETAAMKRVPWGVIVMVCGVTVLIALLEKTGGMDLFTSMLARLASPATVNGVVAFVTGLISSWSSTAGVVLPSFLPTVPGLVEKVGGGDPGGRPQHQRGIGHGRRVAAVHVRRAVRRHGRRPR
jgi:di/tricarboxylate transporter